MSQIVPTVAVLGAGKTALTIGYRVLNLDGTTYAAFSTTGVAETSVLGTYRVAGGVVCPDAGGYIVWGVSGTDYAEATVESTSANVTMWKGSTAPAMTGDSYARLGAPVGASVSADIAAVASAVASVGAGDGTGFYTDTVDDGTDPLDGVRVQLSTDVAGTNRVYETFTDALGVFALSPDPGTYYRWLDLAGYTFTQGVEVMVT